ncbi:MAG: hypothetical protein JNM55_10540 [Anaerolineales bacterium]|nr:hypothetical protein [Anaerolineales bacterium]
MTDSVQKTPRQISIENGEQIIITIMAYLVLFEVFTLIVKIIIGQFITIVDAIRIILTIVSCVYLYKGRNWAKIFLTLGAMLGVFVGVRYVFLTIVNPVFSAFNLILFLVIAILNSVVAYYLIFSIDVDEFMKSRKA